MASPCSLWPRVAACWLFLVSPAWAAPVPMDTLVARALTRVPVLEAATATAEAQRARVDVAGSAYWPQVGLTGTYSRSSGVPQGALGAAPANGALANITLRQSIYNFGQTDAVVEAARANADVSEAQARAVAVDVSFRVREAYLQWAQARALEVRGRDQVRNAERLATQAGSFVRHGVRPNIELTRAQVTLSRARADLIEAVNAVEIGRRTLETALGGESVEGEPAFPSAAPVAWLKRDAVVALTRRLHPGLAAGEAALRGVQATRQGAERTGWPDLMANGAYGVRTQDTGLGPNWQGGLNVSLPLFTGFAIASQREAAEAAERAAQATLRDRLLEIYLAVDRAQLQVTGARARLAALGAALRSAEENNRLAENRYRNGVGAIIEVSEAQNLLAAAQADAVRGEATYHLAIATLIRAMGATGLEPDLIQTTGAPAP